MLLYHAMALRPSTLLYLVCLIALSSCTDTGAQWKSLKPQANAARELMSLDGVWNFALASSENIDQDQAWTRNVPPDLQVPVPASYNDIFVDSEIRDHVGWVFYQRQVTVPSAWSQRRNILRFDAVTHEARVYINDQHVGGHVGGYTPFEVDVTDIVAPGEEFRLTVAVSNILDWHTIPPGHVEVNEYGVRKQIYNHDFFNYAGIARSVWFYSVPEVYINDITVTTEIQEKGKRGIVNFAVTTNKESNFPRVRISLFDEEANRVSEASELQGTLEVDAPTLWQPGAAYLYRLCAELLPGNGEEEPLDIYEISVGIRSVAVQGNQFLINNEPFYFTGFGKHEDTAIRGKGYDPAYMIHDFNLMKWMGANSFRTSHYPYAEEVLDYADRHGIVVIDEVAAVGLNPNLGGDGDAVKAYSPDTISNETQATHAQAIRELVHRDKNHASVVMWCIANEPAAHEEGAREYFEPLVELTRELDPTRPLTFTNEGNAVVEKDLITDLFDVICLNRYYGWYGFTGDLESAERALESELLDWHNTQGRPIIMSEYGADTIAGLHAVNDVPFTEEYQTRLLQMSHRVFDRIGSVIGEHVWNFADFQTPSNSITRVDGNKKGVFTRDRRPKSAVRELRARWTEGVPKAGGKL